MKDPRGPSGSALLLCDAPTRMSKKCDDAISFVHNTGTGRTEMVKQYRAIKTKQTQSGVMLIN